MGFPCRPRHRGRGGLLLHPFTLTACSPQGADGGLLSVALSRGSLRVGVTHHRSRWSPDFPRPRCCGDAAARRSEEHTSELQSRGHLVCRLLLEKKKRTNRIQSYI